MPRKLRPKNTLRILVPPVHNGIGLSCVLQITDQRGEKKFYMVNTVPSDWGRAFSIKEFGSPADPYIVHLGDAGHGVEQSCTCAAHNWGKLCKHIRAMKTLTKRGVL